MDVEIPFFWQFPRNCCESASILLSESVLLVYPEKQIYFVRSRLDSTIHIWIEIDDLVFDVTLDQFEKYDAPVIGGDKVMHHNRFDECESILYENEKAQNSWFPEKEQTFKEVAKSILGIA
ncbi:hypothetical protein FT643_22500 [Ketobacter sp. MCCC 1A13808]|uniref:hypothetical protein n=1 Tax=Ketobacter sp. MCCC 1A13808 TaxID=2602738 RepID=UPI0012EB142A|nr:hypothetical protein [Ketobacter sp. MCCC 1A13808]MVF14910.1 hypothetical protein [Ketobacter sp. MCCC 1A13808]